MYLPTWLELTIKFFIVVYAFVILKYAVDLIKILIKKNN
jgi:hypothetical protein